MPARTAVVVTTTAEFRSSPSRPRKRSALPRGAAVEILRDRNGWYEVDCDLGRGWVASRALGATSRGLVTDYLWQQEALRTVSLEAPPERQLAEPADPLGAALARTWNQHGGLLTALCDVVGVDPGSMVATLQTESNGRGLGPDGRMIIRFENHLFRRYLGDERAGLFDTHFRFDAGRTWLGHEFCPPGGAWQTCHLSQASEWEVLAFARGLDDQAALYSISMGMSQVMGFNHSLIGYDTVGEMFDRFAADIRYQILGMFDYIRGHGDTSPMIEALRVRNYEAFATGYNGNGQAAFYGGLIRTAVARFEQLQGGTPPPPVQGDVYVVQPNESLSVIAARFGTTVAAIAAANGITNIDLVASGQRLRIPGLAPATEAPSSGGATAPPAAEQTYTVQPGDILGRIAARLGVPLQAVIDLNGITNPHLIQPGQVLRIPPASGSRGLRAPRQAPREYLVVQGDSLRSVAAELGLTPEALAAANDLQLVPGQLLRLPPPSRKRR